MLANLAAWSSPELAESMEQLSSASQPLDAPHEAGLDTCKHGCASHCGSHMQWQSCADIALPAALDAGAAPVSRSAVFTGIDHPLPFRPPLGIQLT
jgi:hypothetical protein